MTLPPPSTDPKKPSIDLPPPSTGCVFHPPYTPQAVEGPPLGLGSRRTLPPRAWFRAMRERAVGVSSGAPVRLPLRTRIGRGDPDPSPFSLVGLARACPP